MRGFVGQALKLELEHLLRQAESGAVQSRLTYARPRILFCGLLEFFSSSVDIAACVGIVGINDNMTSETHLSAGSRFDHYAKLILFQSPATSGVNN